MQCLLLVNAVGNVNVAVITCVIRRVSPRIFDYSNISSRISYVYAVLGVTYLPATSLAASALSDTVRFPGLKWGGGMHRSAVAYTCILYCC